MIAKVGDRIVIESQKVGTPAREGDILEVIEADGLIARAKALEPVLLGLLRELAIEHPEVTDVRGRGAAA